MGRYSAAVLLVLLGTMACGRKHARVKAAPVAPVPQTARVEPAPRIPNPRQRHAPAPPPVITDEETGLASWYGHPYHGRQAADGEIYDMETMVAAHRTLPFQTRVRVENLDNGLSTEVRIIDRGPFVNGRIIDLSHAAAKEIQLIGPGVAHVRLHLLATPPVATPGVFAVQVGAFANRDNAERLEMAMRERFGYAQIVRREGNPVLWRVLAGRASSPQDAEGIRAALEKTAFVVRIDDPSAN